MLHLDSGVRTYKAQFQIMHDNDQLGVMVFAEAECKDCPLTTGERQVSVKWFFNHHPLADRGLRPLLGERQLPYQLSDAYELAIQLGSAAAQVVFSQALLNRNDLRTGRLSGMDSRYVMVEHTLPHAEDFFGLVARVEQTFPPMLDGVLTNWIEHHPVPAAR